MNIPKVFSKPSGGSNNSSGSSGFSTFYTNVPPGARSAAVKGTSAALSTAAKNERVQTAAAQQVQSTVDTQLQQKYGMSGNTSFYLSSHLAKGVPAAMEKAGNNEAAMEKVSEKIVDGTANAAFKSSADKETNSYSESYGDNKKVSVDDMRNKLAKLYGGSYTPAYLPPTSATPSSSSVSATPSSTTEWSSYPSSSSAPYTERTQFADPFASFNRPQDTPSSTHTPFNQSSSVSSAVYSTSQTTTMHPSHAQQSGARSHVTAGLFEAIYDFNSSALDELQFSKGDTVVMTGKLNEDWWMGRLKTDPVGQQPRMFPSNFVKPKPAGEKPVVPKKPFSNTQQKYLNAAPPQISSQPYCVALYDYVGQCNGDLSFRSGDQITLTRSVDDNWLEGELFGQKGMFPRNFVRIERDIAPAVTSVEKTKRTVLYDFTATNHDELSVKSGDKVVVVAEMPGCSDWLKCEKGPFSGYLPSNFLAPS